MELLFLFFVVFLIVAIVVLTLIGICWLHLRQDRFFRQYVMGGGVRLSETDYLEGLPFRVEAEDAETVLGIRAAFAKLGRIPRQCVTPEMPVADLFRTQCRLLSTGVDSAEVGMCIEDQLRFEAPETFWDDVHPYGGDSVGGYTEKVMRALDAYKTEHREINMGKE